jgi:hypothetical protein
VRVTGDGVVLLVCVCVCVWEWGGPRKLPSQEGGSFSTERDAGPGKQAQRLKPAAPGSSGQVSQQAQRSSARRPPLGGQAALCPPVPPRRPEW